MIKYAFIAALLFIFMTIMKAEAQKETIRNGAIAFSYPIGQVTIDGDTADWPKNFPKYPFLNVLGRKIDGRKSPTAYFQTGYNLSEQSLYFIVVVKNDAHVVDTSQSATGESQDCYNLYLDSRNLQSGSGVISYQFNEKWKSLSKTEESWDPDIRNSGWNNVRTACRSNGETTVYECSIKLKDQIYEGKTMGIDHLIVDKDPGDPVNTVSYLSWGDRYDKDNSPGRLGYVILMKSPPRTGDIAGKIKWDNGSISKYPERLRVTSLINPDFNIQIPVDTSGVYRVSLPGGKYEISPVWSFQRIGDDMFKIDKAASKIDFMVKQGRSISIHDLYLKTITAPDLVPQKGVMFDFNDDKARKLDDFIRAYQQYYIIPGVSLALIKDGSVIYHKTYGVKNGFTGEPVNDSTLFEAASISKTVFAFAVNRLAERGIIDLDKPLYQYLPFDELAYDDRYKLMTARHVLSHQTGLPNWAYNEPDGKVRLKFTPGTSYGYSGEGFEYLKRVVIRITGKNIESVINEEVIKPLGLHNIFYSKSRHLAEVTAYGHYENYPTRSVLPDSPGVAWSMYTEAVSFSKFVIALQNKIGLKSETYAELFSNQSIVPLDEKEKKMGLDIHYGLGIELEKTPYGFVFEHGGNNGDFQCNFMMFRDLNMGFVIFTNSDSGGRLAYENLGRFLITGR